MSNVLLEKMVVVPRYPIFSWWYLLLSLVIPHDIQWYPLIAPKCRGQFQQKRWIKNSKWRFQSEHHWTSVYLPAMFDETGRCIPMDSPWALGIGQVKAKLLEPGTVSAHVRHGFKLWEAKIFDFEARPARVHQVFQGFVVWICSYRMGYRPGAADPLLWVCIQK